MYQLLMAATDTTPNTDSFVAPFLQYGVVGVAVVVLAWFAYKQIQREQKRSDDYQLQIVELNKQIQAQQVANQTKYEDVIKQVFPALADMLRATQAVTDVSNRLQTELALLERQRNNDGRN